MNGFINNVEFFDESTDITIIGMLDNQLKLIILPKKNISIYEEKKSLIGDKIVDLKLNDHLIKKDLIIDLGNSEKLIEQIFNLTNLALCSESIGVSQSILDKTLEYLTNRDAFGKKIGTFQSIQISRVCSPIINIPGYVGILRKMFAPLVAREASWRWFGTREQAETFCLRKRRTEAKAPALLIN